MYWSEKKWMEVKRSFTGLSLPFIWLSISAGAQRPEWGSLSLSWSWFCSFHWFHGGFKYWHLHSPEYPIPNTSRLILSFQLYERERNLRGEMTFYNSSLVPPATFLQDTLWENPGLWSSFLDLESSILSHQSQSWEKKEVSLKPMPMIKNTLSWPHR